MKNVLKEVAKATIDEVVDLQKRYLFEGYDDSNTVAYNTTRGVINGMILGAIVSVAVNTTVGIAKRII